MFYHLYPQFLHSNCALAVGLLIPNAQALSERRVCDTLLIIDEPQVGHFGVNGTNGERSILHIGHLPI